LRRVVDESGIALLCWQWGIRVVPLQIVALVRASTIRNAIAAALRTLTAPAVPTRMRAFSDVAVPALQRVMRAAVTSRGDRAVGWSPNARIVRSSDGAQDVSKIRCHQS
jgi:hypothetical protein